MSMDKRYNESYDSRNDGGSSRNGILDWSKLDERPKFYKIKEGVNKIDILPFPVKSKNHPLVKRGVLEVGDDDYVLDVWIHKNIGPSESDIVCLKKNYGKPCPCCDQAEEYREEGKKEEFDAYKAKRRVIYNVRDLMAEDPNEVLVLDQSHFKFEKELIESARYNSEGKSIIPFADLEKGKTVKFRGSPSKYMGKTTQEPKDFQFLDREKLVKKAAANAISFDELMILHTPAEIMEIMNGSDDDEDEAPARPKRGEDETPRRSAKDDDEDDIPFEKTAKGKAVEEDETPPARTRAKKGDDDEEEPPAKDKEENPCPYGHRFGKDNDEFDECKNDCPPGKWKDCARAAK